MRCVHAAKLFVKPTLVASEKKMRVCLICANEIGKKRKKEK